MKQLGVTVLCLGLTLSAQAPQAQQGITKTQADEILSKLDQIIKLLDQPAEPDHPARIKMNISSLPSEGVDTAPVTIIEFTDLECPFCAKFHSETYPKIRQAFVDTGKVRFVHWDLPLRIHANALLAAQAGRCAGEQGQFWNMHKWIGDHTQQLLLEDLVGEAVRLRLDLEPFRYCLVTGKYKKAVEKEAAEASGLLHVTGTPTFAIGKTANIVDGEVVVGALPYQAFEDKLNALLK